MTTKQITVGEYEFTPIRILDTDRRGWQLPVCSKGYNCCGAVTVIRIWQYGLGGPGWSERHYIFWPESRGIPAEHHADELIRALVKAKELGPLISTDP